jgi:cellobionic acid phosphorylase
MSSIKVGNKPYVHTETSLALNSPTSIPNASGFLWNAGMLAHVNCQGYVTSQFMQPEPAKYSHAPNLEAKTFIQPEQPFYTEHPGRFVFVKNEKTGEVVSLPYAPMKSKLDKFTFELSRSDVTWQFEVFGILLTWRFTLTKAHQVELWHLSLENINAEEVNLSIYPYFTIGYKSWMNQSAEYVEELNAIIAKSVTPYQKVEDYFKHKSFKDFTTLISDTKPDAWTASFADFVGEGGLTNPSSLHQPYLNKNIACYESPVAVMQFNKALQSNGKTELNFVFGPVTSEQEAAELRDLLTPEINAKERANYHDYIESGKGCLEIVSPDKAFDSFVNNWLPRQVFYHGDVNRLSTDPQTRNFIQDALGMVYIKPEVTKSRLRLAMSQQQVSGQMPDGILLNENAELKYINQVPHSDHCVWLPICTLAYLEETNDVEFLSEQVNFKDGFESSSVEKHLELAIEWLLSDTDERGLSYIRQGDWCDPMNMVGYKGKGVSAWLTIATCYALKCWLKIAQEYGSSDYQSKVTEYLQVEEVLKQTIRTHFWHQNWFSRGITDDGQSFGVSSEQEGRIYLNPQSWALMADVLTPEEAESLLTEVYAQLATPYGMTMLAPSYTQMHEHIGRLTQKSPGVAENGSVYNHASVFFVFALYQHGYGQQAFDLLKRMLPNEETATKVGQLPNFIPNYYRGAYYQFQDYAGRSSQLFNTGTVAWYYKSLVDGLCGVKGFKQGVIFTPLLPDDWPHLTLVRRFRGAELNIKVSRQQGINQQQTFIDKEQVSNNFLSNVEKGKVYQVEIYLPVIEKVKSKLTIVMGVSGSGKSAVAESLAKDSHAVYMDADDFHSLDAKQKMSSGQALTDEDREPWLERMKTHLIMLAASKQTVVLAYSGLKATHRSMFRALPFFDVKFIHLKANEETLTSRMLERESHFFSADLLTSQLEAMESTSDESDVLEISNLGSLEQTITTIKQEVLRE